MPAGTIALTNNSTVVTGSGTNFSTELKANDFIVAIVGGVTYTLGVQSVNSATSVTLTTAYNGPTASGVAWTAVPNAALVGITAQVAADVARAIRGLNLDKANWQKIFSNDQSVTVNLPDLNAFTGPSWGYMATQFGGKADLSGATFSGDINLQKWLYVDGQSNFNGGSVLKGKSVIDGEMSFSTTYNAGLFRNNAGLKSLAIQDSIDRTDLNSELFRNLFASGGTPANAGGPGVWQFNSTPFGWEQYGVCIQVSNRNDTSSAAGSGVWQHYLALGTSGSVVYARNINGIYSSSKLYSTSNTTTNSSGALVPASPIVRIVNDRDAVTRSDILGVENSEYTWSTKRALYNEEAKGCTVSRTDVGTYLIKGAIGLAKDLWSVMDCGNGQGRIIALAEAEETPEGIVVRCYKQKYTLSDDGDLTIEKGTLIDIPNDTWIDVRLEMPADSDYNLRQQDIAAQMNTQQSDTSGS